MAWVVRRLLIPFALGSAICTTLLLVWLTWGSDTEVGVGLNDVAIAAFVVLPFQGIGLGLLVPIALLVCDLSLPRPVYPVFLAIIGAMIGTIVVLPITERPYLLELTLPAACGTLSALVWFAFNRDAIRQRA